jgi:hypothetical protein
MNRKRTMRPITCICKCGCRFTSTQPRHARRCPSCTSPRWIYNSIIDLRREQLNEQPSLTLDQQIQQVERRLARVRARLARSGDTSS